MLGEEIFTEGEDTNNGIVLVACKDEMSCLQLEECITGSPEKVFFLPTCPVIGCVIKCNLNVNM